jgi:hypothetical protein
MTHAGRRRGAKLEAELLEQGVVFALQHAADDAGLVKAIKVRIRAVGSGSSGPRVAR